MMLQLSEILLNFLISKASKSHDNAGNPEHFSLAFLVPTLRILLECIQEHLRRVREFRKKNWPEF